MDKELIKELYQSLVLEHSKNPRNFGVLNKCIHQKGKNPSCGDELTLYIEIENNKIKDVKFEGIGCVLSVSSSSLMTQMIKNKTLEDVQQLISDFISFILEETDSLSDNYEPLHIYQTVHNFPSRVKCVLLAWRTLESLLKNKDNHVVKNEITTEDIK